MRSAINWMQMFEKLDDDTKDYLKMLDEREMQDTKGGWSY